MPEHDLRLLALDGGGVRGLSTLQILKQLMDTINPESPPKPCDYFDMIGGTSTGGLIAIMLGRLGMTVDECIDAYVSLSDRVFRKQRHRLTIKGQVQGRFDSDELERAIKEIVRRQGLAEDVLLQAAPDAKCKVFVCATSNETGDTVRLTSYRSPRGRTRLLRTTKIWEAGRATSAASSFFDPIIIGDFEESFVDGATGANNPVYEVWNEAQDIWPSDPLEDRIKCLVSIGTGLPSLTPFKDDLIGIGQSLLAIATETEKTAERFSRDKSRIDEMGRYYRFNVLRGLEDIGLEDSKRKNTIIAATDRYIESQAVFKQMKASADSMSGREYVGNYRTQFNLQGVPVVNKFVDRPSDMAELEQALLPQRQYRRQKVFVLYGLGGIGKTQLAVEFARRHHRRFSSVFWLDGRTEDSLKQSIATCAGRIPEGQIAESSRAYSATRAGDVDVVVRDVMNWLSRPKNTEWLIIFDNVDRESGEGDTDPHAYNVTRYLSGADHGSILITTLLANLEQLGGSRRLGRLSKEQTQAMFQNRCGGSCDPMESEQLFKLLDGLPLAIAQAGAYLRQSRISVTKYIKLYERQWRGLMELQNRPGIPLREYSDRSVWATWTISYDAVRAKNIAAANLLLLWACLDNKDIWYGLLAEASIRSTDVADCLSEWLPGIASNELDFLRAIQVLRSYSLVEDAQDLASYITHPVVHKWAFHVQDEWQRAVFTRLAVAVVGWAVPAKSEKEHSSVQRRLIPHAQRCWQWILGNNLILGAMHGLGMLYADQGKLIEAEKIYQRALDGKEKALGPEHTSTLDTVNNFGNLYANQGKLGDAEKMYQQALVGKEKALGPEHTSTSTLATVNNLGSLYKFQGKLGEAEKMYQRALDGYEKALRPEHTSTLNTANNLGHLYADQGKLGDAEKMYQQALDGKEKALKPEHTLTLDTVNNFGNLYANQGKLGEAEKMYQRALNRYEKALRPEHISTLNIANNLGFLYADQGKLIEAKKIY
ncbi:FabD/lysophospholipase-like protein [Zopfia rhizophila CBS 207.26]|uniref:FabD/lysophospholipase-like protein n=1 Tax=Zopfia rhizophila CBS 207.26 TaxID=1314779 RepID=A0A6A6DNJ3_9PEZI|nr:FabD/lysophospholipase-like protein [Zopfia rhizophila CBS 207.26]